VLGGTEGANMNFASDTIVGPTSQLSRPNERMCSSSFCHCVLPGTR
jgi:hypothetical protein